MIYFLRHQAAGVLWEHPFSGPPTDIQRAAVAANLRMRFGDRLPRTGEPYWLVVVPVETLGPFDVPAFEPPSPTIPGSSAELSVFKAGGSGSVTNK